MIEDKTKALSEKDLQQTIIRQNEEIIKQNKELEWAHIYHDSIRGIKWMRNLSINIGRWAGNYSFFYILNRVLSNYKPREILEFGLGESSKVISTYLDEFLIDSTHTIIEQDINWKNNFNNHFTLSNRSSIHIFPIQKKNVLGFETNGYEKIEDFITKTYDLYLIDGPMGSPKYSRYDIVNIANSLSKNDEFIIILDDFNRHGEKQTFNQLKKVFLGKGIKIFMGYYVGTKTVAVIGTTKYRFVESL